MTLNDKYNFITKLSLRLWQDLQLLEEVDFDLLHGLHLVVVVMVCDWRFSPSRIVAVWLHHRAAAGRLAGRPRLHLGLVEPGGGGGFGRGRRGPDCLHGEPHLFL